MITTLISIFLSCQYPLKSFCGLIKRKTFDKGLEEIQKSYCDLEDDKELNRTSEKHLVNVLKIWKLVYK
ncbi:hypothetical protein DMENIID0001_154390 [Sergentomyia squamirostris]